MCDGWEDIYTGNEDAMKEASAALSDRPSTRLLGGLCIECGINRCEEENEDYCEACWQKFKDDGNAERIRKIEEGWTVDNTGGIHPPNE